MLHYRLLRHFIPCKDEVGGFICARLWIATNATRSRNDEGTRRKNKTINISITNKKFKKD